MSQARQRNRKQRLKFCTNFALMTKPALCIIFTCDQLSLFSLEINHEATGEGTVIKMIMKQLKSFFN